MAKLQNAQIFSTYLVQRCIPLAVGRFLSQLKNITLQKG
ncbi:hypothetical protein COO91_04735 [Nostoc flagelliforme CCNUN1]|uniref:Uncharacterized protein n=1 Tax=Nostoc flagelliforme CCNUN1 TaxID=2038116 RepID=A0A2K8STU1_9NOSO|nr:hypothetical protein COO91_04735 [Nostoc flagelliforme CCNUN1]